MARRRSAQVATADSEFAEIIGWYEDLLQRTVPPPDLAWEPIKIGPTWQWDNGWVLPRLTLGWRILAWCGVWLRDKHGQPWQFTAEQTRFILWFFAVDEDGDWLHHSAVLQRLKGWGKDPVAACLAVAAMFAEVTFDHFDGDVPVGREESNAWIQIAAVSQEQTKNTMKLFPSLIPAETRAQYGVQIGKVSVFGLGDTRQIEAVTMSPLTLEGGRPTLIIRGETQFWKESNQGHSMAGAIEGNAAKSELGAARMLDICNAYRPGEDSVGERVREAWEATQSKDGEVARAEEFGLLYDSLEAPGDAPLTGDDAPDVVKSIAGDSVWLDTRPRGRIVMSILNLANPPSESRRKWYNQITATADAWVVPQDMDVCEKESRELPRIDEGDRILMFLDCSKSDDATALIGMRVDDGMVFNIGIWQRPAQAKEWVVNRDDVDLTVHTAFEKYRPQGFFADPSDARDDETGDRYWEPYIDAWARKYGKRLRLKAVKSGPAQHVIAWDMRNELHQREFVPMAERVSSDVAEHRFRYDGDTLLTQHFRNARRRPNKFGVSLGKENRESSRKVDAAVAAVGVKLMGARLQNLAKSSTNARRRNTERVVVM